MPPEPPTTKRATTLQRVLVALVVVLLPMYIGGALTGALVPATGLAVLSAVVGIRPDARGPWPAAHRALFALSSALTLFTLLQCLPLPAAVVRVVSPNAYEVWAHATLPLGDAIPSTMTLSLDPGATRLQVLRGVLYTSLFFSCVQIAMTREGVRFLERTVLAATVLMAFVAIGHTALGAKRVFGLYESRDPSSYVEDHIAPLLNSNHLSGYLNLGFAVSIGALLARRPSLPRPLLASAAAVLIAVSIWSSSRGGVLGAVTGLGINLALRLRGHRGVPQKLRDRFSAIATSSMVVVGAVMVALAFGAVARAELTGNRDLSKFRAIADTFGLLPRYPAVGVGRGAFESVFPELGTVRDNWVFSHPENVVAQWLTEWGVLGGVALAAVVVTFLLAARAHRDSACRGAGAALAGAFVHNMVDFHDEMPGVAVALVALAALFVARPGHARSNTGLPKPIRFVTLGFAAVFALFGWVALSHQSEELYEEQKAFQALTLERLMTRQVFHERLRGALLRHPADPYLPYAAAVRALARRDESPLPWISLALERNPTYGRAHLLLGRTMFRSLPPQARLEYRMAYAYDRTLRDAVAHEVAPLVDGYMSALDLCPPGAEGIPLLDSLSTALAARLPSTAWRVDDEILFRDSRNLTALGRRAQARLDDLEDGAPWCESARNKCAEEAVAAARIPADMAVQGCGHPARLAQVLVQAGRTDEAIKMLRARAEQTDDRLGCLRAAFEIAAREHRTREADDLLGLLSRAGCSDSANCATTLAQLAEVEVSRGNAQRGIGLYRQAMERDPEREDLLLRYASLAVEHRLHAQALDAYQRLATRHPERPEYAARVAEQRAAMQTKAWGGKLADPAP